MQSREPKNSEARLNRLRNAMAERNRKSVLRKVKWFAKKNNLPYLSYRYQGDSILYWAVQNGFDDIILELLSVPGIDLEPSQVYYSQHILDASVRYPTSQIFNAIINHPNFVHINSEILCSAFFTAIVLSRTDILALALTNPRFDINMIRSVDGFTPLLLAASDRKVSDETFKFIISQPHVNLNHKDKSGKTALMHAVISNKVKAAATLLECHGLDIDATSNDNEKPALVLACQASDLDIVAEFQAKHMTSNVYIVNWALRNKLEEILQFELTQSYITPYALDETQKPYLQLVIESDRPDLVKSLIAKPDFDMFFQAQYSWIAHSRNPEIWVLFLENEILMNDDAKLIFHTSLYKAALHVKNFALMEVLIKEGMVDINTIAAGNYRAIDICVTNAKHLPLLKFLLAESCLNTAALPGEDSPLMQAAAYNNARAVEWLLPRSDVNYTNHVNRTALHYAMTANNEEIVELLLRKPETRVDIIDAYKKTPLLTALDKGFINGAELLFKYRKIDNLKLQDTAKRTAFFLAVNYGALDVMEKIFMLEPSVIDIPASITPFTLAVSKLKNSIIMLRLLDMGANPTALAEDGNTPLRHAMLNSNYIVAVAIAKKQTDKFDYKDTNGKTDLMVACQLNLENIVNEIIKKNLGCVGLYDQAGNTALIYAVANGNVKITELLLTADNRNVNYKNDEGNTALTIACEKFNDPQLTKLLLKHGADPEIINSNGHNAQHLAIQKQHMMVYHELTNYVKEKAKESKRKTSKFDPMLFSATIIGIDRQELERNQLK